MSGMEGVCVNWCWLLSAAAEGAGKRVRQWAVRLVHDDINTHGSWLQLCNSVQVRWSSRLCFYPQPEAESVAYTCEMAGQFWLLRVLARCEKFTTAVGRARAGGAGVEVRGSSGWWPHPGGLERTGAILLRYANTCVPEPDTHRPPAASTLPLPLLLLLRAGRPNPPLLHHRTAAPPLHPSPPRRLRPSSCSPSPSTSLTRARAVAALRARSAL